MLNLFKVNDKNTGTKPVDFILSLMLTMNGVQRSIQHLHLFMHNVEKWLNMLKKSCGVSTAGFLQYVWPFFNIIHEKVNMFS